MKRFFELKKIEYTNRILTLSVQQYMQQWKTERKLTKIYNKNASSDMKLAGLYINNVNNVEVRFETIENVNIFDSVEYKGKEGTIRDLLLSVKKDNKKIFKGVEQGKGKKALTAYLLMKPKMRVKYQEWLR